MILSSDTHAKIREEISHFPHARGALLVALHFALRERGRFDDEVFAEVGQFFGMRPDEVAEVVSFYSLFNQPPAQAIFQVCTNLPCCLKGARGIVQFLEQRFGIKAGTATADGRFAIAEVECLGSCATAPVVQVNLNPFLENVTTDYLANILESPAKALEAQRPAPMISIVPPGVDAYLLPSNGEKWLSIEDYKRFTVGQLLARKACDRLATWRAIRVIHERARPPPED